MRPTHAHSLDGRLEEGHVATTRDDVAQGIIWIPEIMGFGVRALSSRRKAPLLAPTCVAWGIRGLRSAWPLFVPDIMRRFSKSLFPSLTVGCVRDTIMIGETVISTPEGGKAKWERRAHRYFSSNSVYILIREYFCRCFRKFGKEFCVLLVVCVFYITLNIYFHYFTSDYFYYFPHYY